MPCHLTSNDLIEKEEGGKGGATGFKITFCEGKKMWGGAAVGRVFGYEREKGGEGKIFVLEPKPKGS